MHAATLAAAMTATMSAVANSESQRLQAAYINTAASMATDTNAAMESMMNQTEASVDEATRVAQRLGGKLQEIHKGLKQADQDLAKLQVSIDLCTYFECNNLLCILEGSD